MAGKVKTAHQCWHVSGFSYLICSICTLSQASAKWSKNKRTIIIKKLFFFFGGKKHKRQSRILSTISHIGIASLYLNYFIGMPKNESEHIPKMHVHGKLR